MNAAAHHAGIALRRLELVGALQACRGQAMKQPLHAVDLPLQAMDCNDQSLLLHLASAARSGGVTAPGRRP